MAKPSTDNTALKAEINHLKRCNKKLKYDYMRDLAIHRETLDSLQYALETTPSCTALLYKMLRYLAAELRKTQPVDEPENPTSPTRYTTLMQTQHLVLDLLYIYDREPKEQPGNPPHHE